MNLDSDVRSLRPGDYRILTNGSPIQPQSSTQALQDAINSIYGNAIIANADLAGGTNKIIGFLEDRAGKRSFYFVYNNGGSHTIYQYNASGITRVMRNSLFGWGATDFVDADISGDILLFTSNSNDIFKINVVTAIAGGVYTGAIEEITLISKPPVLPLTLTGKPLGGQTYNFIAYNAFSFYYRYIYNDNSYSVFSAFSETMLLGYASGSIDVTIPASEAIPSTVIKIEYAFRKNGGNEIVIYRSDTLPLGSRTHTFFNNTNLQTIPDTESFKLNDSVPRRAKALRIQKNRLFMFGNKEGFTLTGAPISGGSLSLQNTPGDPYADHEQHVLKDDSAYGVAVSFFDNWQRPIGTRKIGDITNPARTSATPVGKFIRADLSGIVMADIPIEAYSYSIVRTKNKKVAFFLSGPSADLFFRKKKADGTSTYLKAIGTLPVLADFDDLMIDISSFVAISMGYTFNQGDRIKIGFASQVYDLLITGQEGRFVVVNARGLNEALPGGVNRASIAYIEIYTPKISSVEIFYEVGNKYTISNPGTGSRVFSMTTVDLRGDVYFANRYVNTVLPTKYFAYQVAGYSATDPFANVPIQETVGTSPGGPDDIFYSMSFTSNNGPAINPNYMIWADQDGKPVPYNYNGFVEMTKANLRFSDEYNPESQILGLNTFDALNDQRLGIEGGAATGLAVADEVLVALQEVETVAVYVGQGFVNTSDGNSFLAKTESVIGDFVKYRGRRGCIHQASIVTNAGSVYYLDSRKGAVIRRSQDGLTQISEYGKEGGGIQALISTLCLAHEALGANSRIVGGWDPQYQCYVLSFINTADSTGYSFYWHEKSNTWSFRTDMRPEFWGTFGQYQLAFLSGALWKQTIEANYNNFFGVQYTRELQWEIGNESLTKIWTSIEVDVENIFSTGGANENVVLLYHTNGGQLQNRINYLDFKLRNASWRSSFFRNLNDEVYTGDPTSSKYKSSHKTRGQSAFLTINYNGTARNSMKSVTVFYEPHMNSSP